MDWYRECSDRQFDGICAYCGAIADTRDHVPSKALLDEPYTENIPVVPCCYKCNNDFSKDEEYFSCAIECCKHMTTNLSSLKRNKVIKALKRNPKLKSELSESIIIQKDSFGNDFYSFNFDNNRLINVIIKLAKGHARYEHSSPFLEEPKSIFFNTISDLSEEEKRLFYTIPISNKLTEIGSRSSNFVIQKLEGDIVGVISLWEMVQENHYQYLVYYDEVSNHTEVRIELANMFCIQVIL